jgi:hypothetical protein
MWPDLPYPTLVDRMELGLVCTIVVVLVVLGAVYLRRRFRPVHHWGEDDHV